MRGKVRSSFVSQSAVRITPAYAGKRHSTADTSSALRDHPRVCGEKYNSPYDCTGQEGSPPRMRGKETQKKLEEHIQGITPAYAGKR